MQKDANEPKSADDFLQPLHFMKMTFSVIFEQFFVLRSAKVPYKIRRKNHHNPLETFFPWYISLLWGLQSNKTNHLFAFAVLLSCFTL